MSDKTFRGVGLIVFLAIGWLACGTARAADRFVLTEVKVSSSAAGASLVLTFDKDLTGLDYASFEGTRPNGQAYVAFDLKNTVVKPTYKKLKTDSPLIKEIVYAQNTTDPDLVRIVILPSRKIKAACQVSGNSLTIVLTGAVRSTAAPAAPVDRAAAVPIPADKSDTNAIPSKPLITMNMRDASIWGVLQAFSKETGLNVVIGDGVTGLVSVTLHKVTPKEALEAILRPNGYTWTQKGSIIFVSTKKLMRSFNLQHIPAAEAKDIVDNTAPDSVRVAAGKTGNSLSVEASPEDMENVAALIKDIDENPRQVLVMAKIVEMSPSTELLLGTNIKLNNVTPYGTNYGSSRNFAADPDVTANAALKGFFVKLVGPNWEALTQALETQKDINILASPNIMTLNHQKAQIISGEKLGYRTKTQTETSTIEDIKFLEVGTILDYTAHITNDNRVILDIHPKVSEGEITSDGLPNERTTETSTTIMVDSGEIIAIGGLIKQKLTRTEYSIPLLSQIPIFGTLFKRTESKLEKKEIVVFISPTIVTPAFNRSNTQSGQKVEKKFIEDADRAVIE